MEKYVKVGGMQVASVLYDFIEQEALPQTGVDHGAFWKGMDHIFRDLAP